MTRLAVVAPLLLALAGCASGVADPSAPPATATVELVSLYPAAGSPIGENTVLAAEIKYSIEHFQPAADYYLAPMFASTLRPGMTFNSFDRLSDGTRLTTASGTVAIHYRINREMRNSNLARPVRLWFFLMERTGAQTSHVIGQTAPTEY